MVLGSKQFRAAHGGSTPVSVLNVRSSNRRSHPDEEQKRSYLLHQLGPLL